MEEAEFTSPESTDTGPSGSPEKTKEQSEKQKESYKKAQAQIQKTQKDEKKAKQDNAALFLILERFIQNPYYEEFVPQVTLLLSHSAPSRFTLSLIALFYPEATLYMLQSIGKEKSMESMLILHRESSVQNFDESKLHPSIREWMSLWVESSQAYMVDKETSIVMRQKTLQLIDSDDSMVGVLSVGLEFFFMTRNLIIHTATARRYAQHILSELRSVLASSLSHVDSDMLKSVDIDHSQLFGLSDR